MRIIHPLGQTIASNHDVFISVSQSLQFQIDGEVVLNRGNDTAYEFEENEEALSHLRLSSVSLYSFNDCFHDIGMVARMNARLLHVKMRMLLHGNSLLRIVGRNVFEYFCLTQRIAFFVVACEPQTRGLSVEVICYA